MVSEICFGSKVTVYAELIAQWTAITKMYPGWTLTEIKELTPNERHNWLAIAKNYGNR